MKFSLKYLLILIASFSLAAQDFGTISGKVYDKEYGDPIIGAYVMISGMSIGSTTDLDGNFSFETPVGTYDLKVEFIGYNTVTIKQITLEKDAVLKYSIALDESVNASDVVIVEAKTFQNNETGLLVAQKKSEKMFDAISSEQITKSGDSNLGDALKKVTGLTVVGGKNVFVRGLGERYSNVQLNGSVLPSTNPDKKEVPMDIFSSSVVDNIIVQKAYTADQPGEFSGGSVQIKTKEFPEEQILKASYSTSVNDNDLGDSYLSSDEGSTDWLGFGSSVRNLPSSLESANVGDLSTSDKKSVVGNLTRQWTPTNSSIIPNQSFSFTFGNNYQYEDEQQLGVISNFKFSRKNSAQNKLKEDVLSKRENITEGTAKSSLTGMVNAFYKLSPESKIGLKNLFTNEGKNDSKEINTYDGDKDNNYRQTVHKFIQSQLFSSTVIYETFFANTYETKLNTDFTYSVAKREEPNSRNTHFSLNETTQEYSVNLSDRGNKHFYSDQSDRNMNLKLDASSSFLDKVNTKYGINYLRKDREYTTRNFHYERFFGQIYTTEFLTSSASEIFNADNVSDASEQDKIRFLENFREENSYEAEQDLFAAYFSNQFKYSDEFSFNFGLRYENSDQRIFVSQNNTLLAKIQTHDFLPVTNVIYNLNENTNIRFAYSNTLARPEFREMSAVKYEEYFGGRVVSGNPELKRTRISNFDLKYEVFGNNGEMLSVSSFYKKFKNPIEMSFQNATNNEVKPINAEGAFLYGLELEARYQLTNDIRLVGNFSWIKSEVNVGENNTVSRKRALQGQSPYIINSNIFYSPSEENYELSLSYNRFGKRIETVGSYLHDGDEYEQPFDKFDFQAKYKFSGFSLKFNAKNILNSEVQFTQLHQNETRETESYKKGRSFALGVSRNF